MKKVLIIVASVFVATLFAYPLITGPVLVEWHYGIKYGAICDPPFVILNPLRNRQAERVADEFLGELKKGNIQVLDDVVSEDERREHVRLRETELTILSWFAGSRRETDAESNIDYWVKRKYDGGCHSVPANIGLKRVDEKWKVTSYNSIY